MTSSTNKYDGEVCKKSEAVLSEFGKAAIHDAEMGLAVFPLWPNEKKPMTKDGLYAATTDTDQIVSWWKNNPTANIGIACGSVSGGIMVIDVDTKNEDGYDSLHEWEREHGELPEPTVRCKTPSGGAHIYYKVDRKVGNRAGIIPSVDIRGDGGYVVAPPSVINGREYQWEYDPDEYPIAQADETVYEFLSTGKKSNGDEHKSLVVPEKIPDGKRNDTIYRVACSLQSKGLSDAAILNACLTENRERCEPQLDDDEVRRIVESALNHDKGSLVTNREIDLIYTYDKNNNEKIRQCAENVYRVIANDPAVAGKIKADTFNHRIMYLGQLQWKEDGDTFGEWKESDDAELRNYIDLKYGLNVKVHYTDGFLIAVSRNKYNPLTGYLDALEWDGVHRIGSLFSEYLGADSNEYVSAVEHVFLQGMIHRAYSPGCKFDLMPVLIGQQGKGKTTFFRYLACNDEWYDDNFNFRATDSKTTIERMEGKWVLEMGEMASLKKDSLSADSIKAFITSQGEKYRVPYSMRAEFRGRQCVFCGTTNDINFLKDRTGNRRFLPVTIHPERAAKDIFNEDKARPEFIQAVAEAVHYYKDHPNEKPMLPEELIEKAEAEQRRHLEEDGWVSLIQAFLDTTDLDRVNSLCIYDMAFHKEPADMKRAESSRILTIMRNDIEGWHEVGKKRCGMYGNGASCFERDTAGTGFEEVADEDTVPF